jgi:protein-S-isoprenylcysteine O-methyltransferase Ste14/uncharacterized membrane protein YdjX (TVP38/TMEM64 family)
MCKELAGQHVNHTGTAGVIARPPLLFLAALLLGLGSDHLLPLPFAVPEADLVHSIIAGSLILIGLALSAAGIRDFSRAGTPVPTNEPTRALVTTGIHGWSRNPIYVGMFLVCGGIGVAARSPWTLILTLPLAITIRYGVVAREEAYLERRFRDAYRDYKSRVRRWPVAIGQERCPAAPARRVRRLVVRSGLIVIGVLSLVLASCARIPTPQEANDAVLTLREYESWAWALGIALIWGDVVLPIPQTAVIAALGIIYGTLLGGLLGSLGLITGGLLGYVLIRTSARRYVQRFVGPRSLHRMESLFDRGGAWAIVLTRSLPYSVPEVMVFLAGLAGMPTRTFIAALTMGSVPTAFVFAAIGAGWADQPILALGVSYVLPILLLPIVLYLMRPRAQ